MRSNTPKKTAQSPEKHSIQHGNRRKIVHQTCTNIKQIVVPTRDTIRSFRQPYVYFDSNAFLQQPYSPPLSRKILPKNPPDKQAVRSDINLELKKVAKKSTSSVRSSSTQKKKGNVSRMLPEESTLLKINQMQPVPTRSIKESDSKTKKKGFSSVQLSQPDMKINHQQHQQIHMDEHHQFQQIAHKKPGRKSSNEEECPWGLLDVIYNRFQIQDILGEGSFGTVFKALDTKTNELVAVKVIKNTAKSKQMAENEIKMLEKLNERDLKEESGVYKMKSFFVSKNHIVKLLLHFFGLLNFIDNIILSRVEPALHLQLFFFPSLKFLKSITDIFLFQCLVFELLSVNLYQLLKKLDFHGLNLEIIRKFAIQLLNSLSFLKWLGIIHTDIKPENIALKDQNKTGIKLLDFGTSIHVTGRHYDYIMSRFYRAPEIILGHHYDSKIDMWSLGCVLVELYLGTPIFPGSDEQQMVNLLVECLGMPPSSLLLRSSRSELYFTPEGLRNPLVVRGKPVKIGSKPLDSFIQDQTFCNFLSRILTWEPTKRMSPQQALLDPWITEGLSPDLLESHKKQVTRIQERLEGTRVQQLKMKRGMSTPTTQKVRKFSND